MLFINYLQYFFYLANNWDIRIATHIISKEVKGERKYGIYSTGVDELNQLDEKGIDVTHATIYMPASYDLLEHVFSALQMSTFNHFVDIGCGKGRVMCVAAHFGVTRVTGIDFSKDFCDAAKLNLAKTKLLYPILEYKVFNNDAFYFEIPDDADCIFMFNPFDEIIMSGVLENIEISLEKVPRKMTIIYANPLQKHLFLESGYQQIFHRKKLTYLEAIVFTKSPGNCQGSL